VSKKFLYFLLFVAIEAGVICLFNTADVRVVEVSVILFFLCIGIILKFINKYNSKQLEDISWGLFYGSLTMFIVGAGFILYIMVLFRNIAD